MQGTIGVALLAAIVAIVLVAGTGSLPVVAGICVVAAVAAAFDQRRSRSARSTAAPR